MITLCLSSLHVHSFRPAFHLILLPVNSFLSALYAWRQWCLEYERDSRETSSKSPACPVISDHDRP